MGRLSLRTDLAGSVWSEGADDADVVFARSIIVINGGNGTGNGDGGNKSLEALTLPSGASVL